MRLFVGIELPEAVTGNLAETSAKLRELITRQGVRFVDPTKFHITLQFLGEVGESSVPALIAALNGVTGQPFQLSLGDVGGFPSLERPRVVWIGLEGDVFPMEKLAENVSLATLEWIENPADVSFHPHITMARSSPGSKIVGRILASAQLGADAEFFVNEFALFRSDASGYTVIERFPLHT